MDIPKERTSKISQYHAKKHDWELTVNVSRQLAQIEFILVGIGKFNAGSFRTSHLPLLSLPAMEVLRQVQLELTKARAKDKQQRADLLC